MFDILTVKKSDGKMPAIALELASSHRGEYWLRGWNNPI
jgi:hypothetical protein